MRVQGFPWYNTLDMEETKIKNRVRSFERDVFEMPEMAADLGKGRTFFIHTYGCQANVRDGETLAGMLVNMGFTEAGDVDDADLVIFNTCAIRKAAEDHVFGEIGNLKHRKEQNPEKIFALCGCMAQMPAVVERIRTAYPQIDLVFGTHNLDRFPRLLQDFLDRRERTFAVESVPGSVIENLPVQRTSAYKAFVNIMYGCDKFCTYCIVPYTRGRERSRMMEDIVREIKEFKASGGKEVTLLGQNVNAYGKDLGMEDGFTDLLNACADTGIDRIRFYSSHPRDYTVSSIEAMRTRENIMPALHLPVQSGSNDVLRRMNRGYRIERFYELFDDMKARIPDMTFTTDLIVGFPDETDEQFEDTLKLVDYCKFDLAYTFIFSPREGTPAAGYADGIPMRVKKERLQTLNDRISLYARQKNQGYIGRELLVLCDGPSKKNPDTYAGYSEENKLVNFTGRNIQEGDFVKVEITDAKSYTLDGRAAERKGL
ncbi:MAG: tRNA (N6-isopentenyl adenosine(37)-C2)-methylthiotransferase MiaB [Solobacterium sp.]|nr:tRNA (N6-isopentenyl adenosine(37)-C2)-methylthiotransferase MiaB [Solobacterium sp.]